MKVVKAPYWTPHLFGLNFSSAMKLSSHSLPLTNWHCIEGETEHVNSHTSLHLVWYLDCWWFIGCRSPILDATLICMCAHRLLTSIHHVRALRKQLCPQDSWEIVEGLRGGFSNVLEPQKQEGFMLKRRKWPMKGWHKVSSINCEVHERHALPPT